jgi:hypothetical protein
MENRKAAPAPSRRERGSRASQSAAHRRTEKRRAGHRLDFSDSAAMTSAACE